MTPSEFLKQYTDMSVFVVPAQGDVTTEGSWTSVHVKKYHLGTSSYRAVLWQDVSTKVAKGAKVKVKTIDGVEVTSDLLTYSQIWNLFRFPFAGKGSPEQVQATIQLLYRFRTNKATVEQFAGGAGPAKDNNFIGLDCNGFVGNYLQRVAWNKYNWWNQNNEHDPGPDTTIRDLFLDNTNPVYTLDEFGRGSRSIYLFAFCADDGSKIYDHGDGPGGAGHIMITDPGVNSYMKDAVRVTVSESTASNIGGSKGGPVTSEYIIKKVIKEGNPKLRIGSVFTVWRGGLESMAMSVKIGSLK
ncbi:MAG TPA: hypothetical protein VGL53_05485 [Bryobacteraceae bacterium]|jgi:hypothetical protein